VEPRWIDDPTALGELVGELAEEDVYGVDTEFQGERSYHPRLALVQVAWSRGLALVDPLAVDPSPLARVLDGPGTMVVHAGDQDYGILERACGTLPAVAFDTQVAAAFLGLGTPSLAVLCDRLLQVRLAKGDRLTDWTRRPLDAAQRAYAASDVEHLLALHERLVERLDQAGRRTWALEECAARLARDRSRPDPDTAWWRMKGSRSLRGTSRGVAQELAAWRERRAEATDQPPRFVLPDLAMAGIVQRPPHNREQLRAVRGLDGRHLRDGAASEILEVIGRGLQLSADALRLPPRESTDRSLQPAASILAAWLQQRAAELELDPSVLATRADLVALLDGRESRLASGWRHELVGEPIDRLLAGDAVIALGDGGRRLLLLERPRG